MLSAIPNAPTTTVASEQVVHEHSHSDEDIKPNVQDRVTPRRRVVTKAAATEQVTLEAPLAMLPAIERSTASTAHKYLFNEALHMLPAKCRNTLQNFYVKYEKQESRGLAGKTVMILDGTIKSEDELRALFIHESGHNFDLGCLKGTPEAGKSSFSDGDEAIYKDDPSLQYYSISWITSGVQKSNANPEDFVSGYASYDIFEDFAEGFAYFVLQNDEFAKRAETNDAMAAKYAFFRDVLFDGEVPQIATGYSKYKGKAPWDVTKLSYNWHPETRLAQR